MKCSSFWLFALGFAALSFASPARADVVGPPPDDCPVGTEGATCHGGPYCSPVECTSDMECGSGETCNDLPFCVSTILCAGLLPPDANLMDYERAKVEAPCPTANECTQGATCKTLKVCVPPESTSTSSSGSGSAGSCGCRLAPSAPLEASFGALALAGLGAATALRRRQRGAEASRAARQRRA